MINKLTEKIKQEKGRLIKHNFENERSAVAGFCPECEGIVSFVSEIQHYICLNPDCDFEADVNGEQVRKTEITIPKL